MAGGRDGKTEKPTPKRRREARKEGNIARSVDLVSWTAVLMASFLLPVVMGRGAVMGKELFAGVSSVFSEPSESQALAHFSEAGRALMGLVAPVMIGAVILAITINVAQVGFVFTSKPLKPSLKRLNPLEGFKRILSAKSAWELLKGIAKMTVVGVVAWPFVRRMADELPGGVGVPLWATTSHIGDQILALLRATGFAGVALALGDYAYQRRSTNKQLMMTKQEIREEMRQAEGSPELKGRIKSRQAAMSRNRMLSMVRMADAVVVNPVHIAVAIKYEPGAGAPKVVAKGEGFVAEKIREAAEQHSVPIVESIPLARALYAACQVDREIPPQMYEGVARLLAFVHHLSRRHRGFGAGYPKLPEMAASL